MDARIKELIPLGNKLYSLRIGIGLNDRYPYLPGNQASVLSVKGNPLLSGYLMSSPYVDDDLIITGYSSRKPQVKAGGKVDLRPASGSFVLRPVSDYVRDFIFIAESNGILPVMSMLNSLLRVELRSNIRVIWLNTEDQGTFLSQLDQWEAMVHGRMEVILPEHMNDLKIWLDSLFSSPSEMPHRIYVSGSTGFLTRMITLLEKKAVPSGIMHLHNTNV